MIDRSKDQYLSVIYAKFFINQTNGSRDIVKCTSKHKGRTSKHSHSGRGSLSFYCPASMVPARQPRSSPWNLCEGEYPISSCQQHRTSSEGSGGTSLGGSGSFQGLSGGKLIFFFPEPKIFCSGDFRGEINFCQSPKHKNWCSGGGGKLIFGLSLNSYLNKIVKGKLFLWSPQTNFFVVLGQMNFFPSPN